MDAIGSVAFAFIGAHAAVTARLGIDGIVFFAVLTACGGGILCEIVARRAPRAFHDGLYVLPPVLVGCTFWALGDLFKMPLAAGVLLAISLIVQYAVAKWGGSLRDCVKEVFLRYSNFKEKVRQGVFTDATRKERIES
jgi:uncharacterized membrane protein YeiH